jgi:crotonobetainyl-CoA:carnitine CoA-transferase CaiB-like acyl-CoA transferase
MGPLNSLKILDFTTLLPGPFASMLLADLGARVLRIESPHRPDLARTTPPLDESGESVIHGHLNRSKLSLSLDLKHPQARDLVKRLVQEYDVVLEQFRPGVMQRLGLGYEELRQANPRLIFCSITGYGQDGPHRDRAGHDNNYLALSGVAEGCRHADQAPVAASIQIADQAAGSLYGLIGLLAAVVHRERTGVGQAVDVSMTHSAFAMNALSGAAFLGGGVSVPGGHGMLGGDSFYGYYQTRDGRYMSVGSLEPQFRQRLCAGLEREDLLPLAMSTTPSDEKAFRKVLGDLFMMRDLADWVGVFENMDACVEPVLTFAEAAASELMNSRDMVVAVPREGGGSQDQIACPLKFSESSAAYLHPGASLGAHNRQVLEELGLSAGQIEQLIDAGVLG